MLWGSTHLQDQPLSRAKAEKVEGAAAALLSPLHQFLPILLSVCAVRHSLCDV